MSENPLISVIIPVYNLEESISKTIDSVVGQSYNNLQIIIVNDGSSDRSLDICRKYASSDSRITLIDKKNEGLPMARKDGLNLAKGEYIHNFDGGDYIGENVYSILAERLKDNNYPDILFFGFSSIFENQLVQSEKYSASINSSIDLLRHIWATQQYNNVWHYISKKELHEDINFNKELSLSEDTWYTSQLIYKAKTFGFSNDYIYYYLITEGSMTRSSMSDKGARSLITVNQLIDSFMKDTPEYGEMKKELLILKLRSYTEILLGGWLDYMPEFAPVFIEAFQQYPDVECLRPIKSVKKIVKLYTKNRFLYYLKVRHYKMKGKIGRIKK